MTGKEIFVSLFNIKSFADILVGILIALIGAILGYFKILVMDNLVMFQNVALIIIADFICGVSVSIMKDNFQTKKALKVIWYFATYESLLALVLTTEKAYPSAFWLSECIMMPLMLFQLISVIKNLHILGLIPSSQLTYILSKIDKHKDE